MYNIHRENNPTKPVIASSHHAEKEFKRWIEENDYSRIKDADGLEWRLEVVVLERPSKKDLHRGVLEMTFSAKASATAEDFVRTGTLNPDHDARMIEMLMGEKVPLALKPTRLLSESVDKSRTLFMETVQKIKRELREGPLEPIKRRLIARYVEQRREFGSSVS